MYKIKNIKCEILNIRAWTSFDFFLKVPETIKLTTFLKLTNSIRIMQNKNSTNELLKFVKSVLE